LISGTHGNEPAGAMYLEQLRQKISKKMDLNVKVIIIPKVNRCGLLKNIRKVPELSIRNWDLNRAYPVGDEKTPDIINHYLYLIKQAQLVVDLHEAHGYRQINTKTKGSGIYTNGYGHSSTIVQEMVHNVNEIIDNKQHKFITEEIALIPGSLRGYCTEHKIPYILIETTGIEPLELRLKKIDNIIATLFSFINLFK
jgi:predicted deacylase